MLVTALAANLGILPAPGPYLSVPQLWTVKVATPLLMFGADLRKVLQSTSQLLKAFLAGTCGTVIGAILATVLLSTEMTGKMDST